MKYLDSMITYSEVPDKVSLSIWITECQGTCEGCSMKELRESIGKELSTKVLLDIIKTQGKFAQVVTFLGEGKNKNELIELMITVLRYTDKKICLYSGQERMDEDIRKLVTYYKVGPYIERLGGLTSEKTNQVFWVKDKDNLFHNETWKFWKKKKVIPKIAKSSKEIKQEYNRKKSLELGVACQVFKEK